MDVLPPELWGLVGAYTGARCAANILAHSISHDLAHLLGHGECTLNISPMGDYLHYDIHITGKRLFPWLIRRGVEGMAATAIKTCAERNAPISRLELNNLTHAEIMPMIEALALAPFRINYIKLYRCENCAELLRRCRELADVRTIVIDSCAITDISPLVGVPNIELRHCQGLTDVSLLGAQSRVTIVGCPVNDYDVLAHVRHLYISVDNKAAGDNEAAGDGWAAGDGGLTAATRLGNRVSIEIENGEFTAFRLYHSDAYDLGFLRLSGTRLADDAKPLRLSGTRLADDAKPLRLSGTRLVDDAKPLRLSGTRLADDAKPLRLSGTRLADDAKPLRGVGDSLRSVTLFHCTRISDLGPLRQMHTVRLERCPGVSDLRPLSGCRRVALRDMSGVRSVSPLRSVHTVSVINCPHVADWPTLRDVCSLECDVDVPGAHHDVIYAGSRLEDMLAEQRGCYRLATSGDVSRGRQRALIAAHPGVRHYDIEIHDLFD